MELKTLIIRQIKEVYGNVKIYDERVQQGLKTPAFLVLFVNQNHQRQLGRQSARTVSVAVHYFPQSPDVRSECESILDEFQNSFRYIQNRFHVHELEGEVVDDVLVITFNVKMHVTERIEGIKMNQLEVLEIERKEEIANL